MNQLQDRDIVVKSVQYHMLSYRMPGGRWRAEAARNGKVIETMDAPGFLSVQAGLRRRLMRKGMPR